MRYFQVLFTALCLCPFSLYAQPGSTNENEVALERKLLEAQQEIFLEDYEEATQKFEALWKEYPEEALVAYELARLYARSDQKGKALEMGEKAAALEPDNTWYQITLADMYQLSEMPEKAGEVYTRLRKKEPENDYFLFQEAYFHVLSNQPSEAIKVYDELENRLGVIPEVALKKERLYRGMGKEKKALEELEKLADAFPNQLEYQHQLAEYLVLLDQRSEALAVYRHILSIDPSDGKARLALEGGPDIPEKASRDEKLLVLFEDPNVDIDLKVQQILPRLSEAVEKEDQTALQQLRPLAEKLVEVHPREAKSHSLLGDIHYYTKGWDAAENSYRTALKYDKSVFPVWEQLLYLLTDKGDWPALAEVSTEASNLFPNQAIVYYLNGWALCETYQYKPAMRALQQAELMSMRNPALQLQILNKMGETLARSGQAVKAWSYFEKALQQAPEAIPIRANYAFRLAQAGELEKAKAQLAQLPKATTPPSSYQAVTGMIALETERYEAAVEAFNRVVKASKRPIPELFEMTGNAYEKMGDAQTARQWWGKAIEAGAQSSALQEKLNQ